MKDKKRKMYNKGKKVDGNAMARREYKHGGPAGCQPTYSENMPKAKAN